MATRAITNENYLVDQDASVSFESPKPVDLELPLAALSYQFKWDVGVVGTVTFFASIYPTPFEWEKLISCEEVSFTINNSNETESEIVSIPGLWLNVGFIKFEFVPSGSSTGNISVASRGVPI